MLSNPFQTNRIPRTTECKCCRSQAEMVGVVDFSRCGVDVVAEVVATGRPLEPASIVLRKVEPYAGWPVYYYRCGNCSFTFTRAFDDWTTADFARHIYNDDYVRHDQDYLEARPQQYAELLTARFGHARDSLRILDYGSGSGLLQRKLEGCGFGSVQSYDPFTQGVRATGRFDLIVRVEVFEHVLDPTALMKDLKGLLNPDGALLFSTLCCPADVIERGIANWWYCVPRNGHISFYSPESLSLLTAGCELQYTQLSDYLHIARHGQVPAWLSASGLA